MNKARFNEVTNKLNKMFNSSSEEQKDKLVSDLKSWLKASRTEDKDKVEAITCFLAVKNIF